MKADAHFEVQIAERGIPREWCERVVKTPYKSMKQLNGRIRHWAFIDEVGRWLRVVIEADGETYHTAFFDRTFARKNRP